MPRFLDLDTWPRRAAFEFFRDYDDPYFNVCAPIEVGPLVELCHARDDVPFSLASLYVLMRVANEYEPLRYRLEEGRVLVHDIIDVGTTTLLDAERLAFMYVPYAGSFAEFRENAAWARQGIDRSRNIIDARDERTDLIHFSSIPWVAFTSVTNARKRIKDDSVPKVMFGKYARNGDRITMPVSVEVHHALMDGLHVGECFQRLERHFTDPGPLIPPG